MDNSNRSNAIYVLAFAHFFLQSQTMQMMYKIVATELKAMGNVDSHPRDFLNFYCLGNRENIPEERSSDNGVKVIVRRKSIFLLL